MAENAHRNTGRTNDKEQRLSDKKPAISKIFDCLTTTVIKPGEKKSSMKYLSRNLKVAAKLLNTEDFYFTKDIIYFLNDVLKNNNEAISFVNKLYEKDKEYFLYIVGKEAIRGNSGLEELLSTIDEDKGDVLAIKNKKGAQTDESAQIDKNAQTDKNALIDKKDANLDNFYIAMSKSNSTKVNAFLLSILIKRAKLRKKIRKEILSNVEKYSNTFRKIKFYITLAKNHYVIDKRQLVAILKKEENFNSLNMLYGVLLLDEGEWEFVKERILSIKMERLKRFDTFMKITKHMYAIATENGLDVSGNCHISDFFFSVLRELSGRATLFSEREQVLYKELLALLINDIKCLEFVLKMDNKIFEVLIDRYREIERKGLNKKDVGENNGKLHIKVTNSVKLDGKCPFDPLISYLDRNIDYEKNLREQILERNPLVLNNIDKLTLCKKNYTDLPIKTKLLFLTSNVKAFSLKEVTTSIDENLNSEDREVTFLNYRVAVKAVKHIKDDTLLKKIIKSLVASIRDDDLFLIAIEIINVFLKRKIRIEKRDLVRFIYISNDRLDSSQVYKFFCLVLKRFKNLLLLIYNLMITNGNRKIGSKIIGKMRWSKVVVLLVFDYSMKDFATKIGVLRALVEISKTMRVKHKRPKSRFSGSFVRHILPIMTHSLTQNDQTLRKHGLLLLHEILHFHVERTIAIHLFNLFFINVFMEEPVFYPCFVLFLRLLDSNFVFKYLLCGLEHGCRKVRERYRRLLRIAERNGVLLDEL